MSRIRRDWRPLDGMTSGFQQAFRLVQPSAIKPLQRSGAGLLTKVPAEGTSTHHCLDSDIFKPEFLVHILLHPPQHGFKRHPTGVGGSCTMNCACPPSRSRGITEVLAASAATVEPEFRRIMCKHRSSSAAAPAEVRNCPLSTKRTSASASTVGYRRTNSLATAQWAQRCDSDERIPGLCPFFKGSAICAIVLSPSKKPLAFRSHTERGIAARGSPKKHRALQYDEGR